MIAHRKVRDARAQLHDNARAFVAKDGREEALRIGTGQGVGIRVANPGRLQLDHHLAGLGAFELHRFHRKRLPCRPRHRRLYVHPQLSSQPHANGRTLQR